MWSNIETKRKRRERRAEGEQGKVSIVVMIGHHGTCWRQCCRQLVSYKESLYRA